MGPRGPQGLIKIPPGVPGFKDSTFHVLKKNEWGNILKNSIFEKLNF